MVCGILLKSSLSISQVSTVTRHNITQKQYNNEKITKIISGLYNERINPEFYKYVKNDKINIHNKIEPS